jgi:hypothetical protein
MFPYPKDGEAGVLPSAALYCPNRHIAALALLALRRVRICPKCEVIFNSSSRERGLLHSRSWRGALLYHAGERSNRRKTKRGSAASRRGRSACEH